MALLVGPVKVAYRTAIGGMRVELVTEVSLHAADIQSGRRAFSGWVLVQGEIISIELMP